MSDHADTCPARDPRVVGNCTKVCCRCDCGAGMPRNGEVGR